MKNNDEESFYEVNGTYTFLDKEGEFYLANILPGGQSSVLQNRVLVPFSLDEQEYEAIVNGTYRTVDNQFFECSTTTTITATPAEQLIELEFKFDHDLDPPNNVKILGFIDYLAEKDIFISDFLINQ